MTERRHPCRRIAAILPAFEIDRQDAGAPQARCLRSLSPLKQGSAVGQVAFGVVEGLVFVRRR